ncbi:GNAT family N-acetyltransferase [Argonema antarcticum]|uniref:GNAT family N-acetyltransferase n=1 Tax=Argonema antarcticum TaxID=2942763 RepID=UPI002011F65D|nr:GNAT family N-acetyltransferase [Argonema antarcticum]MCL1472116.1 GNAT family N-acetyltransferase [Argonema antarcticum A004/B2]
MLLLPGYQLHAGSGLDRALLVKFLQRTYQELFPVQNYSHLAETVDRYFSKETPLWWVEFVGKGEDHPDSSPRGGGTEGGKGGQKVCEWVACLWLGNAIDQVNGDRHAHIFLLYVVPEHRRQGVGTALMRHAEDWAKARGDRQMGLQVFEVNQPAMNLYRNLGYQTQSLWMLKPLFPKNVE